MRAALVGCLCGIALWGGLVFAAATMWRLSQNDPSHMVTAGIGPGHNAPCLVAFDDPRPGRDGFRPQSHGL